MVKPLYVKLVVVYCASPITLFVVVFFHLFVYLTCQRSQHVYPALRGARYIISPLLWIGLVLHVVAWNLCFSASSTTKNQARAIFIPTGSRTMSSLQIFTKDDQLFVFHISMHKMTVAFHLGVSIVMYSILWDMRARQIGMTRKAVFFDTFVLRHGRKVGSVKRVQRSLAKASRKICMPLWLQAHLPQHKS